MYQANLMKKIMTDRESGVQDGLDVLPKTLEFIQILQQEVTVRGFQHRVYPFHLLRSIQART